MNRNTAWFGVVALGAAIALTGVYSRAQTATPKREKKADGGAKSGRPESKTAVLARKLAKPISIDNGMNTTTSLKAALEYYSGHYGLTIVMDTKALNDAKKPNSEDLPEPEATPVKLPKMNNVPVGTILRLLLAQANATYLIRPHYIEVTSLEQATPDRLLKQRVSAAFDKIPLEDALQELSDQSAVSIILDVRARDAARIAVTATLKNDITVLAAARLLADMADLKAIRVGGTLYVTTKENAKVLESEEKKTRKCKRKKSKKEKAPKVEPVAAM